MLQPILASLSMLLLFAPGAAAPSAPPVGGGEYQVRIQQYITIRVARMPSARGSAPVAPIEWDERKTDTCVKISELTPIAFAREDSVDLLLASGKRLRAKLDNDCSAMEFYAGFYIKPRDDGKFCADRDSFRLRSGGECPIRAFRALIPSR